MLTVIETTLFYLIRLFSSTLEVLFAFLLMNAFFTPHYRAKAPRWLAFLVTTGVLLALQETGNGGTIKTIAEMLLIFLVSLVIYEGDIKLKLIFDVVFSLFLALSELLSGFVFSRFIDKIPGIDTGSFFYRILAIELSNIFMLSFIILIGIFTKSKNKSIPFRYWVLLLTVPVTTLATLTVYQYYMDQIAPGERLNVYIIFSGVGLVFINILVFTLFSKLQNQMDMRRKSDLLATQMRLEELSFQKLEDSYNRTRELRHDLKNHIFCLRGLAENGTREDLLEYLNTMTDAVEESTYISISRNSAVDAVLNEKLLYAQKEGIGTQFEIPPLTACPVKPMDLCTIISNALDNAIEANGEIPNPEQRYLSLKITLTDDMLILSAENPVAVAPKLHGKLLPTTKADKENHGLGLKSIESTVKKYHGDMLTKCENLTFHLVVSLKFPTKAEGKS